MTRGMTRDLTTTSVRLVLTFVALASLMLVWATVAQAQSPSDDQYGSPTASGTAALNDAGFPGGADTAGGNDSATGGDSELAASTSGGAGGTSMGVLPSTGGSQLFFLALGTIALGSTALLALRRVAR
jgi:LPXTG-motif cell wall-anchored protein